MFTFIDFDEASPDFEYFILGFLFEFMDILFFYFFYSIVCLAVNINLYASNDS